MAPIRVGFVGLSKAGGWANTSHINYLRDTTAYKIVALCNSSVAAAEAAKKAHNLDDSVKTYGSPDDLASDAEVDLVVVAVNVVRHHDLIKPALEKGKMAYVEWPLGRNLEEAEELNALAKAKGVRNIIGLQGHRSPVIDAVAKAVKEGRVGKVLSTNWKVALDNDPANVSTSVSYFLKKEIGGNHLTIHFGHIIESVTRVLGGFESLTSQLSNQFPVVNLIDADGKVVEKGVKKDTPDQIMLQGTLKSGAVSSIHFRSGPPFKDDPAVVWHIQGDKGQIQLTATSALLGFGLPGTSIKLFDHASGSVEELETAPDDKEGLPYPARNVARMYDSFAKGEGYPTFEDAVENHRIIDLMWKSSDGGKKVVFP